MGAGVREEGWQRTVQEPQPSPAQPSVGAPRGGGKAASCRRLLLLARDRQSQAGQLGQTWRFVSPTSRLPLTLTSQAPPPPPESREARGFMGSSASSVAPLAPQPAAFTQRTVEGNQQPPSGQDSHGSGLDGSRAGLPGLQLAASRYTPHGPGLQVSSDSHLIAW